MDERSVIFWEKLYQQLFSWGNLKVATFHGKRAFTLGSNFWGGNYIWGNFPGGNYSEDEKMLLGAIFRTLI